MDLIYDYLEVFPLQADTVTGEIRRQATRLAQAIGFDTVKAEEIAIVVNEMLSNVNQHGGGTGLFFLSKIHSEKSTGIEFFCCDFGSGLGGNSLVLKDGYSKKQSLGIGLGAIERLSDEFVLDPKILPEYVRRSLTHPPGLCVFARKWLSPANWSLMNPHLQIGAASRPLAGEMFNGDDYLVLHPEQHLTILAVIDGLGHGKDAHLAAEAAKERMLIRAGLPPETLMQQVHEALKPTRGATVAITSLDTATQKLTFIGVGNIEARLIRPNQTSNLLSTNGIVGHNLRKTRLIQESFAPGDLILLFSDGVALHLLPGVMNWQATPQCIADEIIHEFTKPNDDATVLIARYLA